MARDQDELASLLRSLADLIESCSSADLRSLMSGEARVEIVRKPIEKKPTAESKQHRSTADDEELIDLANRLLTLESREDGMKILEEKQLSRRNLEWLARELDLPIRKTDNIERMREMIIDVTIGGRLNSRAIRGE